MSSLTATATPSTQLTATLAELSDELSSDVQADFIERLSQWGNVRAAAQAAGRSRAQFYRLRRANRLFAQLWDAALLLARPRVEEVLADRALNGVQEAVFYHGEEIATRTRYDSRLLLAHLGRLDRIEQDREVLAAARDFDDLLEDLRNPPEELVDDLSDLYPELYDDDGDEDEEEDFDGEEDFDDDADDDRDGDADGEPEAGERDEGAGGGAAGGAGDHTPRAGPGSSELDMRYASYCEQQGARGPDRRG